MGKKQTWRVALAGNPNCGKTSLFNALTGSHQHVGNYAGVTVERREGEFQHQGFDFRVADLPGTYSLTSFSPEERIAQDELLGKRFDVVIAVVDSTALKRSLVLVAQLMHLGQPLVLALNMSDEAHAAGQQIDLAQLRSLLGFPVVETVGHRAQGIESLRDAVLEQAQKNTAKHRLRLGELWEKAQSAVIAKLPKRASQIAPLPWLASKLLVEDQRYIQRLQDLGNKAGEARSDETKETDGRERPAKSSEIKGQGGKIHHALDEARRQRKKIEQSSGHDASLFLMERYYGFVDGLLHEVMRSQARADARARSDALDAVLAHPVIGFPFFLVVMYGIFWLTFSVGEIPMHWIEAGFAWLGQAISGLWPQGSDSPLRSLLVDGLIGGVGGVLVFVPNIFLLYLGLAVLEDTGYMARAAFITDQLMHRFGLHGKSFIPMVTGFGCTIPGIMATRTLDNQRDRLTTMLVLPLMSCGARLPIWMLLVPVFFAPMWRAPALWGIYTLGIGLALVLALLLRSTLFRGEEAPFVMELPPYRLPTAKAILLHMLEPSWFYVRKAGTVILGISIVMWAATSYPKRPQPERSEAQTHLSQTLTTSKTAQQAAQDLEYSIAGRVGKAMEPVFWPLGFDWRIDTALIGAFAAKEVFVAQLGIIFALGAVEEVTPALDVPKNALATHDGGAGGPGKALEASDQLRQEIGRAYPLSTGIPLMIFLLVATPCMATIAVTRRESGSWKWALLQFGGLTGLGYVLALLAHWLIKALS